jgi:hypothetical protein
LGECSSCIKVRIAQLDPLALLVGHQPEFQIGVVQLPERLAGRLSHLALHGQQFFFLLAERVLLEPHDPLQDQPVRRQFLGVQPRLQLAGGHGQNLRADIAGRLPGSGRHVLERASSPW